MIYGASYDYLSGDVTLLYDGEPMTRNEVQEVMQNHLDSVGVAEDPELLTHLKPSGSQVLGVVTFTWPSL